jgi:hypothetical protein
MGDEDLDSYYNSEDGIDTEKANSQPDDAIKVAWSKTDDEATEAGGAAAALQSDLDNIAHAAKWMAPLGLIPELRAPVVIFAAVADAVAYLNAKGYLFKMPGASEVHREVADAHARDGADDVRSHGVILQKFDVQHLKLLPPDQLKRITTDYNGYIQRTQQPGSHVHTLALGVQQRRARWDRRHRAMYDYLQYRTHGQMVHAYVGVAAANVVQVKAQQAAAHDLPQLESYLKSLR